jgi:hypothetical protein
MSKVCKALWESIQLSANGDIKPCCIYKGSTVNFKDGHDIKDAWSYFEPIRKQMLDGKTPLGCKICEQKANSGGTPRKFWYDYQIKNHLDEYSLNPEMDLRHLDINFGNKCNLKCRMCGSWGSSTWFKDEEALAKLNKEYKRVANPKQDLWRLPDNYWNDKKDWFKNVERIDFKGGEPLMQEQMIPFLKKLVEWGYADQIQITYVTNGTKTPDELKDIWPKFKKLVVRFSFEGTGKLYSYIRGGKNTIEDLENNIENYFSKFPNIQMGASPTVSIYNIFDLANCYEWLCKMTEKYPGHFADVDGWEFHNVVTSPMYLSPVIMPDKLKKLAVSRIENIEHDSGKPFQTYIDSLCLEHKGYEQAYWKTFINFTKDLDKLRNQNVLKYIPELKEYW